jgi:hypothetical protein
MASSRPAHQRVTQTVSWLQNGGYNMMNFRRKYLTRRTITTIINYSDLYQEIIIFSRQDWLWFMAIFVFAYLTWSSIYYFLIIPQGFSIEFISYYLVHAIFSYAMILLVSFLTYSATQNPRRTIPEIIALMIIFYPQPYQDGLGLDYEDIQQLKRIAEIEQSSADWRSTYVNFAIVSIVAVLLANFNFLWNYFLFPAFEQIFLGKDSISTGLDVRLPQLTYLQSVIGAFLVVLAVLWLLYKWLSYFREFISSEYANRALLLACEELLAIYRVKNLPQNERIPFWERRALLELYGYRLVAFEKANSSQKQWAPLDLRENGLWILVPPARYPITSRIGLFFAGLKRKITMKARTR